MFCDDFLLSEEQDLNLRIQDLQSDKRMEKSSLGALVWHLVHRATIVTLALAAGAMHYWHVSSMFENDRNFSQITPLEREMSLRTEMGFYYSFYKTVVEERLLLNGIAKLANDRLVEYPDEVNAINRFNIYPEILTGALYHYCAGWLMRYRSVLLEPMLFYLQAVWWCAGGTLSALFLSAVALCGNTAGGVLAVAQYLANHAECTRVQWAPNERENFAQPFLLAQMALVTLQLRRPAHRANTLALQTSILLLNCACLLFWQFSQFVLLTQVAIVFVMEQLCIISTRRLCLFLHAHFCGLHMALMFTQGNDMLMTSLYTSFFAVVSIYSLVLSSLRLKSIESRTDLMIEAWLVLIRIWIVVSASLWLKNVINDLLDVEDDSHVYDILYSKFTNYKTFHTMLYTCSPVFAFLPMSFFYKITQTGLLPLVGIGVSNVLYYWLFVSRKERKESSKKENTEVTKKKNKKVSKVEEGSGEDSGIENTAAEIKARKKNKRRRKSSSKSQIEDSDDAKTKNIEKTDELTEENATKAVAKDDAIERDKDEMPENSERKVVAKKLELEKSCQEKAKKRNKTDKWVQFLRRMDVDAGIFYNISQMFVFGCMALIIMRLKLLFTPHLCIVASLAAKPTYYSRSVKNNKRWCACVAVALASVAAYHGYHNLMLERSYVGEFYDGPLEELLRWVSERTGARAVFAGPVPLTAAVLLSTRRAVVQHPHYEQRALRQRTFAVYKTYGRFSPAELYTEMSRLRVTYLLLEMQYCYGRSGQRTFAVYKTYGRFSPAELYTEMSRLRVTYLLLEMQYCYGRSGMGCTLEEIWDHEVPSLRDRPRLCHRLLTEDVPHFYKVFQNENYAVFRVHDYSVRYTPRYYDT